jgi:methyltransferase
MFFWIFLIFILFQRISELYIARKNETHVRALGAIEHDSSGYRYIVLLHVLFFISLIAERYFLGTEVHSFYLFFLSVFVLAQLLRYWSIFSLGVFWNTRILILPGTERIRSGPYRYFSHPNYLAVCIELLIIPLIFSCYLTAICFTVLNALVLKRRISIEEHALKVLVQD